MPFRFADPSLPVMPGLDPGIHRAAALDCRVEPGNDRGRRPWRGQDPVA
jgi:hypothetical protein